MRKNRKVAQRSLFINKDVELRSKLISETLHIKASSIEQAKSILSSLRSTFVNGSDEDLSILYLNLMQGSAREVRSASINLSKLPGWIERIHVCRHEVLSLYGFPRLILKSLNSTRRCRHYGNQYVCTDNYGSGLYAPSKRTILQCCKGLDLIENVSSCHLPMKKNEVRRSARRRKLKNRSRSRNSRKVKKNFIRRKHRIRTKKKGRKTKTKNGNRGNIRARKKPSQTTSLVPTKRILSAEVIDRNENEIRSFFDNLLIPKQILLSDFHNNDIYYAVSNNSIRFNNFDSIWTANCKVVTEFNKKTEIDSVYHVVDGLIKDVDMSIAEYLQFHSSLFSSLVQVLEQLGALSLLSSHNQTLTLIAPSNTAFSRLPLSVDHESKSCLKQLIENFIIEGVFCSAGAGKQLKTIKGNILASYKDELTSNVYINGIQLDKTDIMATNGVIHLIDHITYGANSLVDILKTSPELSLFYEFHKSTNKLKALSRLRNVTLITPTNSAFVKEPDLDSPKTLRDTNLLREQLDYYIIDSTVNISNWRNSFKRGFRLMTKQTRKPIHINYYPIKTRITDVNGQIRYIRDDAISIQCTRISSNQPEYRNCAGSVILVNQLLKHPKATLMDILTSNSENQFSILIGIVKKCGLQEILQSDNDFTFLAPTNSIFYRIGPIIMEKLFSNQETARRILSFHLIPGFHCKDELLQRSYRHLTLNGQFIYSCPKRSRVLFGRKKLRGKTLFPDLIADNGVIHAIDNLLLPKHYDSLIYPDV